MPLWISLFYQCFLIPVILNLTSKDYLTYYYDPIIRKFNRVQEVKDSYQDVCIEVGEGCLLLFWWRVSCGQSWCCRGCSNVIIIITIVIVIIITIIIIIIIIMVMILILCNNLHYFTLLFNCHCQTEKSEWLTEFLSDIKVNVGSVNCSHSSFGTDTNSICFKPVECPVRHHGEREYPVKVGYRRPLVMPIRWGPIRFIDSFYLYQKLSNQVMINNFSEEVGRIKYPASFRSGLVIGLILGLLIPIIIAAIIFVLWYAKRIKRLNIKKREGQMLTSNQPPSQTRNVSFQSFCSVYLMNN